MRNKPYRIKNLICRALTIGQVDHFARFLNKDKLLVVMYHGITRKKYDPFVWTQLPESVFHGQMEFIKRNYTVLSMHDLIRILKSGLKFPERPAMITFDDGLRNNYSVAYPILKEYSICATIFLTMDFIETERFFWFDELFFLVRQGVVQGYDFSKIGITEKVFCVNRDIWDVYLNHVERLKRMCEQEQKDIIEQLRREIKVNMSSFVEDFGILNWDQIQEMNKSGLIHFGVHTATHRILSELREEEWEKEIHEPRLQLSNILGQEVLSFSYPNGRPDIDFNMTHEEFLNRCGYRCAFTTESVLNDKKVNPYRIGRIPAGNDFTSDRNYFRLNTSDVPNVLKSILKPVIHDDINNSA